MRSIFLIFLILVFTPSLVTASVLGLDISADGSVGDDNRDFTLGWEFSLHEDVMLTSLGTWDQGADGLNVAQKVSVWKTSGELLASVMVDNSATAVDSASEQGQWLFASISGTFLLAGDYLIGANRAGDSDDPFQFGNTVVTTDASILTWNESRFSNLNSFGLPVNSASGTQYFGPNLMIRSVSVPEPGTMGILGVGLVGFWMTRKRRA